MESGRGQIENMIVVEGRLKTWFSKIPSMYIVRTVLFLPLRLKRYCTKVSNSYSTTSHESTDGAWLVCDEHPECILLFGHPIAPEARRVRRTRLQGSCGSGRRSRFTVHRDLVGEE